MHYLVTATGPQFSGAVERASDSAIEAEGYYHSLSRLCGHAGKVLLYLDGRVIGPAKLAAMVAAERKHEGAVRT